VHTDERTKNETVVIIKRTLKTFSYHADSFYRDKGSKRNNFVNHETEKPLTKDIKKFYRKRYYLFSKFDRGIKIDEESWYSITPETIAKHIAGRVNEVFGEGSGNVLDSFCGVGGDLIQFGRKCGFCVGVDVDSVKIEYANHNAGIYNVLDKI
jgi:trimethylguanosine synthase